jgi:hypothetical protein
MTAEQIASLAQLSFDELDTLLQRRAEEDRTLKALRQAAHARERSRRQLEREAREIVDVDEMDELVA